MSNNCPTCEQPIPDNSPYTAAEVHASVKTDFSDDWTDFYSYGMSRGYSKLQLRGRAVQTNQVERNPTLTYESYSSTPIWVVFSLDGPAGTQYFKMSGYESSYEGCMWDGKLKEVKATEKTIIEYV